MKLYAVNGSARKKKNTATLLQSALDGAASVEGYGSIETEMIHLHDYLYNGCIGCMQCKRIGGKSYGRCAVQDEMTPIMEKLSEADGIIFGSPIYFGSITGKLHSFLERFLFQTLVYDKNYSSLAKKRMPTACIYTMNVTEAQMEQFGYKKSLMFMENALGRMLTPPQIYYCYNTYQVDDYAKYKIESFSVEDKERQKETQFPLDCKAAFSLGVSMVK